jgi:N-methylhydantoinase B
MRAEVAALPDGRWEAEDFPRQRRHHRRAAADPRGAEISGRPADARLHRHRAGDGGAGQHRAGPPPSPASMWRSSTSSRAARQCRGDAPARHRDPRRLAARGRVPAPTGGYTETILRMIDVIFVAMAQAAPDRWWPTPMARSTRCPSPGHRGDGRRWVMFSFYGGGHGGTRRNRRAQPRQRADLDRDDPAGGDPRGRLSR